MISLSGLRDNPGARRRPIRVGRGIGSGKGKTAGSGGKGQTARSGVSIHGFEGGQMPLYRRLPKRGFKNYLAKCYAELNLSSLQQAIDSKKLSTDRTISMQDLRDSGIINRIFDGVRLLGKGAIKTGVQIRVTGASRAAILAIEKAGGAVHIVSLNERDKP